MEPAIDTPKKDRIKRSRLLGRYELIGALARGGMGTVYLGRHAGEAGFHRLFAIKILHEHLSEKPLFVNMLRDEARIAARLHHPNVVPVIDLGTAGKDHYIVLDYIEGPSFSNLWKRSRDKLPRKLMVAILIDALDGLHAAHILKDENGEELHLIHRDVSPSNILVGTDGIARITDFGIAKAKSRITSTQPGTRKGKLQYMSPEQIKDSASLDHRTDVWSVGVILWNALCGDRLFRADNDGATIEAILRKEIPPPSTTEAKPPACFDEVVLRALDRDPEKRYASAAEMADVLRKITIEQNLMGSRRELVELIEELYGDDLERRRADIREVMQRQLKAPIPSEPSHVTSIPSFPSPSSFIPIERISVSSYISKPNSGMLSSEVLKPSPFGSHNRLLWAAFALTVAVLVIVSIIFYYRPAHPSIEITDLKANKNDEQKPTVSLAVTQPKPDMSPVSLQTSQSNESQSSEPQSESFMSKNEEAKNRRLQEDNKSKKHRRTRRSVWTATLPPSTAAVTPKNAPARSDPEPELKLEPASDPISSSVPDNKSASKDEFERNPYLAR